MYYLSVLFVLHDRPMTLSLTLSCLPLKPVVNWCIVCFNTKHLCILPAQCIYMIWKDLRTKSEYFASSLTDSCLTETECVYCSVRNKYLNEIQVCVRVGRVNVVWWVGLVGSCKGMKTPLDSVNRLFNWLHGAESFLGSEYTPFTSIK